MAQRHYQRVPETSLSVDMSGRCHRVFGAICFYATGAISDATVTLISVKTGIHRREIPRLIRDIEAEGLIVPERRSGVRTLYKIPGLLTVSENANGADEETVSENPNGTVRENPNGPPLGISPQTVSENPNGTISEIPNATREKETFTREGRAPDKGFSNGKGKGAGKPISPTWRVPSRFYGSGASEDYITDQGARFLAYSLAHGVLYADENEGFRLWLLRCRDFGQGPPAEEPPAKPVSQDEAVAIARAAHEAKRNGRVLQ